MKEYAIGEVAKLAQVSVRTLHHYDSIGLLKPSSRAVSGYRFYTDKDLNILHDVLFYRALGFSLKRIIEVLKHDTNQRRDLLHSQKLLINEHIDRLMNMRKQLEDTLETEELNMANKQKFEALAGFDPDQYEAEVKEKWGETDASRESARRTKKYNNDDWARYKKEVDALNNELVGVMKNEHAANSTEALTVIEKMRLQIDQWFYPCSRQMHAQLGEMYVMDERFTEGYEAIHPGMAEFMKLATAANYENHSD